MSQNNHILITPPDQVWNDNLSIFLIDFAWDQINQIVDPLRGSPIDLNIYVYQTSDENATWLMNVANACDLVIMNVEKTSKNDIFKGRLLNNAKKVYYTTGRPDVEKIWTQNKISDPLTVILEKIQLHTTRGDLVE